MLISTDVVIIGAGPVGLFAGFQAGMLGMKCHIIDSLEKIGGQCSALYPEKPIYDIPAYPKIDAQNLINNLHLQAAPFNPTFHLEQQVVKLIQEEGNFLVQTSSNVTIRSKVIIIAAGCGSFGPNKPTDIENIAEFENRSVFYSVQNRDSFLGKHVAIAGGGDSAVDWAINLSEVAKKIYLIHRRNKFKAAPSSLEQLKILSEKKLVEIIIGYKLHTLEGSNGSLSSINLITLDGQQSMTINAEILLPFFGLSQQLGPIVQWGLNVKNHHITVSPPNYNTNIDGIYAIGDIATYEGKLKLILTGFAEASHALHHSYQKVFEGKALHFEHSTTKGIKIEA